MPNQARLTRVQPWALPALAFAVLLLLIGGPAPAAGDAPADPALPTDQIIIRFDDATTRAGIPARPDRLLDRLSAAAGVPLTFVRPMSGDAWVFRLPEPMSEAAVAAIGRDLTALPEVVRAEPDAIQTTMPVGEPVAAAAAGRAATADLTPDDPAFADQWHYRYTPGTEEGLNLPPAWAITTGSADVVVAVIDTGILPHADLAGRVLPGYDFINDPVVANDGDGRDSDPADPGDWFSANQCYLGNKARPSTWHGTHVAGTIGAASNNGSDVAGVNWGARILPVRVLGTCGGYLSDIVDGIRWAAGLAVPFAPPNPNPARVLNLSLGGSGTCEESYQEAFDDVVAVGAVAVVAAGNSSALADFYRPASCDGVITVAAGDRAGDLAWYSNYGSVVEVTAPGGETNEQSAAGVLSTFNTGTTVPGNDDLAFYQGTSMAAPHVAGLAALLIGHTPTLTPAQVSSLIQDTARDFPAGSNCAPWACGEGMADAFAALSALEDTPGCATPTAPAPAAPDDGATTDDATPSFAWAPADDATRYELQTDAGPAFSAPATIETDEVVYTPADPLEPGLYYWRVRGLNQGEGCDAAGEWSTVWSFTIEAPPGCATPAAPAPAAPDDGATTDDASPSFAWAPADDATRYELQIDADPAFSAPLIAGTDEVVHTPADPLEPGLYYWRVRGLNQGEGCDAAGDWSTVWSFTVEAPPVEEFRLYLPGVLGEG